MIEKVGVWVPERLPGLPSQPSSNELCDLGHTSSLVFTLVSMFAKGAK